MSSTLDIVFASYRLAYIIVRYDIHIVDYSSDYKGIMMETSILLDRCKEKEKKRLYYHTDWEAIRATSKHHLATRYTWTSLDTKSQLDQVAEDLVALMNTTLEEMVPRAKCCSCDERS
jgi:acyl-ACP thioesterase